MSDGRHNTLSRSAAAEEEEEEETVYSFNRPRALRGGSVDGRKTFSGKSVR